MKKRIFVVGTLAVGLLLACQEDLNKLNPNGNTVDTYFKNTNELTSGVNAAYAILQGNDLVAREWFFLHDLRSDECVSGGGQLEAPRNAVLTGSLDPNNYVSNSVWTSFFRLIHRANIAIVSGTAIQTAGSDETLKKRLIAEAKFLRAFAYTDLVAMWGEVPIYDTYVKTTTESKGRSTVAQVYDFIVKDLSEAQLDLPKSYSGADLGRVPQGAAQLLLARAYMQKGDYAKAKVELEKIKASGVYSLTEKFLDNFLEETEYNKETLFEMSFTEDGTGINWNTGAGDSDIPSWGGSPESSARGQEYSAVGWRNVIPSSRLLDEFERPSKGDTKEDPRLRYTFYFPGDKFNNGTNEIGGADFPLQGNSSMFEGKEQLISWRKYSFLYKKTATGETNINSGINHRLMRYSEVLLSLAECENEAGNTAAAIGYLNQIRNRADVQMPNYPTSRFKCSNKTEILAAIMHERMVEMAGEQQRNRDILRWRAQGKLTTEPISYFSAKYKLLPLPQEEIDNNPNIDKNNPGY